MNSLIGLGFLFLVLTTLAFLSGKNFFGSESFFPFGRNFTGNFTGNFSGNESQNNSGKREHPVLEYQRKSSYDTHPANWGDFIRPLGIDVGPNQSFLRGNYENAYGGNAYGGNAYGGNAYGETYGPKPGMMMNVPIPSGALKESNEKWNYPFYYQQKPLPPYDYFKPYGPNQNNMQHNLVYADIPFYKRNLLPGSMSKTYGIYSGASNIYGTDLSIPALGYTRSDAIPFISSVSSFAPFPEVTTEWEKIGMIHTVNPTDNTIMNLYRKPIAPLQDLFQYMVQNKDGFVIPLIHTNFLENGDIINHIQGFESLGSWKANIYVNNKWVWA